ncbi:MAG TPA: hypothetical protein VF876_10535 [Burkholderiales bacterium]
MILCINATHRFAAGLAERVAAIARLIGRIDLPERGACIFCGGLHRNRRGHGGEQ